MPADNLQAETRFNRMVLGSWWITVAALGALRMWQGETFEAILLLASASFTALLGVGLSIDRQRSTDREASEGARLQKSAALFSLIAITTVVACAIVNRAYLWAVIECMALVWIFPAVIAPQVMAWWRKRSHSAGAQPAA